MKKILKEITKLLKKDDYKNKLGATNFFENDEIMGIFIYDDSCSELAKKRLFQSVLVDNLLNLQTVNYILNTTPEEREELKRLSEISFHKKELERLEKKHKLELVPPSKKYYS